MNYTRAVLLLGFLVTCLSGYSSAIMEYYGKLIGSLEELVDPEISGVTGTVYAVNDKTLYISDFIYDGNSEDVFFYASRYNFPDDRGFKVQDWDNDGYPLRKYNKEGVALSLPGGTTLNEIRMVYVWNEKLKVSLGHIKIPKNFDYPKPRKIGALKGVHAISSGNIIILDMQTLLIPHFYYHGEVAESKFWVSGKQTRWSITGEASKGLTPDGIQIPDENGNTAPLGSYYGKTIILTLPGDLTVADIGSFGIWDEKFATSFASIEIPDMSNLPPSRRMLKISTKPITRLLHTEDAKLSSYASDNKIKSRQTESIDQDLINTGLLPPRFDRNSNSDNTESPQSELDLPSFLLPPKFSKSTNPNTLQPPNLTGNKYSEKAAEYKPPTAKITYPNDDYDYYDYVNDNSENKDINSSKTNDKRASNANDFDVNSHTATLIGLQAPPSSKRNTDISPNDGVKTQGATLTRLNGKWFYLVPADID